MCPLCPVNQAIWLLCTGAREAAFQNIKTIAKYLADELISVAKGSCNFSATRRKRERVTRTETPGHLAKDHRRVRPHPQGGLSSPGLSLVMRFGPLAFPP